MRFWTFNTTRQNRQRQSKLAWIFKARTTTPGIMPGSWLSVLLGAVSILIQRQHQLGIARAGQYAVAIQGMADYRGSVMDQTRRNNEIWIQRRPGHWRVMQTALGGRIPGPTFFVHRHVVGLYIEILMIPLLHHCVSVSSDSHENVDMNFYPEIKKPHSTEPQSLKISQKPPQKPVVDLVFGGWLK